MLTRREVLLELKRVGVTEASRMKTDLREFEKYLAESHGVAVEGRKKSFQERNPGLPGFPAKEPRGK